MIKNPYLNAVAAAGYIILIVLVISSFESPDSPDNIFMPMVMLSLLVLSVALMAVLFFYEPVRLFLDNQKQEALRFFLQTLATFASFVIILLVLMVSL